MMNRRNFLTLCSKFGLTYASYPLLSALPSLARAVDLELSQNKRFLTVYSPHGMHQPSWTCGEGDQQGNDWNLSNVLNPLQPVKDKTLVLEGISRYGNTHPQRHQQGMVGFMTGNELYNEGFSIDQMLADQWNTQVLHLGVQSSPRLHNGKSNYDNFRISFRGDGERGAQIANNNPFTAFQQTFGSITPQNPYESFATNRSVLDALLGEINSVKSRLSTNDLQLLDSHQQSIRDIECRLHGVYCNEEISEVPSAPASCQPPAMIAQPSNLDKWLTEQQNFPTIARLQADISVAAMVCNISPVVVLQHAATESTHTYSWVTNDRGDPATSGNHHSLSHNIYSSSNAVRDFNAIQNWYAEQVSYMAQKLDAVPEGDGTVLDNSLIWWATCLGTPQSHHQNNWPSVLVGSAGGFFETNQALDFRKEQNGNCYRDPNNCIRDDRSDTSQVDLLNTIAASLGMGATDNRAVVGNLTNERDGTYVGNAYHGLIRKMMA